MFCSDVDDNTYENLSLVKPLKTLWLDVEPFSDQGWSSSSKTDLFRLSFLWQHAAKFGYELLDDCFCKKCAPDTQLKHSLRAFDSCLVEKRPLMSFLEPCDVLAPYQTFCLESDTFDASTGRSGSYSCLHELTWRVTWAEWAAAGL